MCAAEPCLATRLAKEGEWRVSRERLRSSEAPRHRRLTVGGARLRVECRPVRPQATKEDGGCSSRP